MCSGPGTHIIDCYATSFEKQTSYLHIWRKKEKKLYLIYIFLFSILEHSFSLIDGIAIGCIEE